jgi:hypothetical protein
MERRAISVLALSLVLSASSFANDTNLAQSLAKKPATRELLSESQLVKKMATDLASSLKRKNADLSTAKQTSDEIVQRSAQIRKLIGELEQQSTSMNSGQIAELNRLKELGVLLQVFVSNKSQVLESGATEAQRESLRANALGVATRAQLIEKSVTKLGM